MPNSPLKPSLASATLHSTLLAPCGPAPSTTGWRRGAPRPATSRCPAQPASEPPLNLGIGTGFADVTEFLHPGTTIDLLNLTGLSNVSLAAGAAGALTPTALPLVFSSSTQGAAVWAATELLLWDGTFEMADDAFVNRLQAAVDTGRMLNGNLTVEAQLFSPVNGSMDVRLIYDWSRTETPIELLDLRTDLTTVAVHSAPRGPSSTTTISRGTSCT